MIIHPKFSLFIDIWKFHFSCFWNPALKNVIIRFGLRSVPGKFMRISQRDPVDVAHKEAVALATTIHKLDHVPQDVRRRFAGMSKEQQVVEIKKYEATISLSLHDKIQAFVIEERKKGTDAREIKRLAFKKFKVRII